MNKVAITTVRSAKDMALFARFGNQLYANNPYAVPDLEFDIKDTFNPKKNAAYEFSESELFLAHKEGRVVGRVAAIINHRANETWNVKNVRFGYLDFVDDPEVSAALLDAVEQWGRAKGMTNCQGPMGFTDFDKEGMLIEGFDKLGSMITYYNHPYYIDHMDAMGYEKEIDWVQIRVQVPDEIPERFCRGAEMVMKRYNLHLMRMTADMLKNKGYGKKVFDLLNEAYSPLFGYSHLSDKQIESYISLYLKLLDLRFMSCIMDADDNLVGVGITMNSMSRALQKAKGRLLPFGWFHILRALRFKMEDTVDMLLVAIKPEYQGKGVNSLLFYDLIPIYIKAGFKWAETGPQLETNAKELNQWNVLNPTFPKRRRCYHKKIK